MTEDRILDELTSIKERLSAHTVIMNDILTPSIAKIEQHLTYQNGDMRKAKSDIIEIKTNCSHIQDNKKTAHEIRKEKQNNFYKAAGLVFTAIGLLFALFKILPNKVEKQVFLIQRESDSLYTLSPGLKMRSQTSFDIDTINKIYLDIRYKDAHEN